MDKLLRPARFDVEPNTPGAEKVYKHWKTTFNNYLESAIDSSIDSAVVERKKHHALINGVSTQVFDLICDCSDFPSAIAALDNAFIKPENIIYNRHLLITCKQEKMQSVDAYMQELEKLVKGCQFETVTATQNKEQYMRDAFINGISSAQIRQRLLENRELKLSEAYQQARALEQAQQQSASYDSYTIPSAEHVPNDFVAAIPKKQSTGDQKCFFCGNERHARSNCPAKESECRICHKKGHWDKVCRSKPVAVIASSENSMPSLA